MPRIVDLTLTLEAGMRGVEFLPACNLHEQGWKATTLRLYSHCGTHMDAPVHYGVPEQGIDRIMLEHCMGPAWVADLSGIASRAKIEPRDLGEIREKLRPGDGLLLRTGWSALAGETRYRDELPRVSADVAHWCVDHGVRLLGVEPPAVADVNDREEIVAVHRILLGAGIIIVEGLAGLDLLRENRIFFVALPLKIAGGDGSPVRALAIEGIPPEGWLAGSGS